MAWLPIAYRDFYDVPRAILVRWNGAWYFLESPFDDVRDEYSSMYTIHRLPELWADPAAERDWGSFSRLGKVVGNVPVDRVQFDPSRRKLVADKLFAWLT